MVSAVRAELGSWHFEWFPALGFLFVLGDWLMSLDPPVALPWLLCFAGLFFLIRASRGSGSGPTNPGG